MWLQQAWSRLLLLACNPMHREPTQAYQMSFAGSSMHAPHQLHFLHNVHHDFKVSSAAAGALAKNPFGQSV